MSLPDTLVSDPLDGSLLDSLVIASHGTANPGRHRSWDYNTPFPKVRTLVKCTIGDHIAVAHAGTDDIIDHTQPIAVFGAGRKVTVDQLLAAADGIMLIEDGFWFEPEDSGSVVLDNDVMVSVFGPEAVAKVNRQKRRARRERKAAETAKLASDQRAAPNGLTTVAMNDRFQFALLQDIQDGVASTAITFPSGLSHLMYQYMLNIEHLVVEEFTASNQQRITAGNEPGLEHIFGHEVAGKVADWFAADKETKRATEAFRADRYRQAAADAEANKHLVLEESAALARFVHPIEDPASNEVPELNESPEDRPLRWKVIPATIAAVILIAIWRKTLGKGASL